VSVTTSGITRPSTPRDAGDTQRVTTASKEFRSQ
jgi:hypothetical protein